MKYIFETNYDKKTLNSKNHNRNDNFDNYHCFFV